MTKYLIVTHYISNRKSISLQQLPRFITPKPTFGAAILQLIAQGLQPTLTPFRCKRYLFIYIILIINDRMNRKYNIFLYITQKMYFHIGEAISWHAQ